jgi:HEAT repeat protein
MLFLSFMLAFAPAVQDDKAAEKAAAEAVDAFKKAFKGTEAEKLGALQDLAKVQHPKTIAKLASVVANPEATNIRQSAARALAQFAEQKKPAATALCNLLPALVPEPPVFGAVCDALGDLQEASALPTLSRFFDDKDEGVARRTLTAAGKIGSPASVEPLISLLSRYEKAAKAGTGGAGVGYTDPKTGAGVVAGTDSKARDRAQAMVSTLNGALREITKEPHTTAEAWSAWWAKNKATFKK